MGRVAVAACTLARTPSSCSGKASRSAATNMSPAMPPSASRWICMLAVSGQQSPLQSYSGPSKGGDHLVPGMQPLDLAATADSVRQPDEAVAADAVNTLDTWPRGGEGF